MRSVAFRPFPSFRHRVGLTPRAKGLVLLTLLAGLSPLAVRAQDTEQMTSREGIALQNQIMDLRQQLSQMQSAAPWTQGSGNGQGNGILPPPAPEGGGNGGPPAAGGDLTAQLLDRVMTLEQQVRDMRGQLDQLTNQVQQQNATLAKQIDDMNFAMQNGGHPASRPATVPDAAPAGGTPAAAGSDEDDAPAAKRTPDVVMRDGNAALMRGDYAAAQAAAKQVLAGPRSPLQIDAQFLMAQSLAGQKQYRQSAVAYYDTYNRSPRSGRAPDALLGVAASLLAIGDKTSACQALAKLKSEFPSPAPRVKTAETAYRTRAGCH